MIEQLYQGCWANLDNHLAEMETVELVALQRALQAVAMSGDP